MKTPRPIDIIGGGLAGLSLGIALRRAGVPVTVSEAGKYPRHRVCGEFITGLSPATIDRLGLERILADAIYQRDIAWFERGELVRRHRLPSPALGLSRFTIDARLAQEFTAVGGVLQVGHRAVDPVPLPGRVFATGRRVGQSPWIGLKVHARGLALAADLEIHLGENCYVGLARVEHGRVNVCGLFRRRRVTAGPRELLFGYLRNAGLGDLAARIERAGVEPDSFCAVAALAFDRRIDAVERVRLGDACAMIPPFTGNGMAMAFQSAEAALGPLLAYARGETDWPETCRATSCALRGRFRVRLASAHALHPFLLQPRRQRVLAALTRSRLLPLSPLYAALH